VLYAPAMANPLLELPLLGAAALSSLPAAIFVTEVAASFLPRRVPRGAVPAPGPIAVIVPAHNESLGIEATVRHILTQLRPSDRLIVVADNCSDDTAQLARNAGASVLERQDKERRGKGYALSHAAEHLRAVPPDVVIIMDADCRVTAGTLEALAALSVARNRPVQAVYLMGQPATKSALAGIGAFAFTVRNLVRPRGLARLGAPCLLTGTGMAFPWPVYRDAPATHSFLVEDLLLGHELAIGGTPPLLAEHVVVTSELPEGAEASFKQRRRWEHGQLTVLSQVVPRLFKEGLVRLRPSLWALALDGLVPPLALVVFAQLIATAFVVLLSVAAGSIWPAALTALSSLGMAVLIAWVSYGRQDLPFRDLLKVPSYILWKLPLYRTFAERGAHGEWERTERSQDKTQKS
jgi:cellulose synthase/poly-beta-1,6-N-acetylglucosamine synthase-like glycosyltransferase